MRATHWPSQGLVDSYRATGDWSGLTLASQLVDRVATDGDRIAVVDGERRLTFRELHDQASALAGAMMDVGLRASDIVAFQLPNCLEAAIVCWASLLAGATVNPIVPIYRECELGYILAEAQPRFVFAPAAHRSTDFVDLYGRVPAPEHCAVVHLDLGATDRDWRAEIGATSTSDHPAPPHDADAIALLLYTSGTTADPKGVLHSHNTLGYEIDSQSALYELTDADVLFNPSPVTHITGFLWGLLAPVFLGARSVLLERWDPATAWSIIHDERASFMMFSATFVRNLLAAENRPAVAPSHVRIVACGGADMDADLISMSRRVIGPTYRLYGSSECPSVVASGPEARPGDPDRVDGYRFGSTEVDILLEDGSSAPIGTAGEIVWRGPDAFLGYLDATANEGSFTEDGFGRSGDLGMFGFDGALQVTGRIKDIINRSGEKFSAFDIEEALLRHPSICEVAVVSSPDETTGERVCAYIVSTDMPSVADIRQFVINHGLAIQKAPERLVYVHGLPRTASGKVKKASLRDQEWRWVEPLRGVRRIEERHR